MFVIVFAMLVIIAAAGVLVAVMAYPNQGREVPHAPIVNEALNKVAGWFGLGRDDRDRTLVTSASSKRSASTEQQG